MKKNEIISLEITDLTISGSGVGHADGMAVFVPYTAVGDRIKAQILKVKKQLAFGKVREIETPSPDRIENDCPAYPPCGGCVFRHISYDAELRLKEHQVRENFRRIGGLDVPIAPIVPAPDIAGYRNKAQYPVTMDEHGLHIGFFAPRSHRVIDCRDCRLQPKEFAEILAVIADWIIACRVPVYRETDGTGLLRHIYLRRAAATGEVMVCLVAARDALPQTERLIDALTTRFPAIQSIILNINPDDTNVILGKTCRTLYGSDRITDILCGVRVRLSPLSFYQVNHAQAQRLYGIAADCAELQKEQTLLDLYCGAGTIGLSMANRVRQVIGVEIIPEAVEDAKQNAAANGIRNARFLCADAAQAAQQLQSEQITPDVVIVDPPRKGCAPALLETVAEMAPEKIVYVSCDPATLARDCAALTRLGYTVQTVTPVDMFPRTGHVETVVLMTAQ